MFLNRVWCLGAGLLVFVLLLVGTVATAAPLEASHLDMIRQTKMLRVCIWPEYFGISYRNPKTGQISGMDADLARELARDLGVGLKFVDSSLLRLVDDVAHDHCDIGMFAMGITGLRGEKLRFTQPHLKSDIYAVARTGNSRIKEWGDIDRKGTVVALTKGALHESAVRERLKNVVLLGMDSPAACEHEVESGRADVFLTDFPLSRHALETTDWARLLVPPSAYHVTSYGWAMAPGDDRWYARVDYFMASIKKDGRLLTAAKRYKLDSMAVTD